MLESGTKQELTARQKEVLGLLCKGLTNSEICRVLNISENTVKVHLANIYKILDVTNRTEAVTAVMEQECPAPRREVCVMIGHEEDIKNTPLAHSLFLSIVEALHGYHLFQIKFCQTSEVNNNCCYQIKLDASKEQDQALFISLHRGSDSALLWSHLQNIENSDQVKQLSIQITIQLYRNMVQSAADTYGENPAVAPAWWYASCYTSIKIENRSKADFEKCQMILQDLLKNESGRDFVACTLASLYYSAIVEHWVKSAEYVVKIGEIACATMRETPNSTNSMFTMALYNILIENKQEAITYLEQILITNPLCIMSRKILALIMGEK